ncbi:MAG: hypothetical protein WDN31_06600 [Hyphomicrobium sp.]
MGLAGFAVAAFLAWLAFNDPFGDRGTQRRRDARAVQPPPRGAGATGRIDLRGCRAGPAGARLHAPRPGPAPTRTHRRLSSTPCCGRHPAWFSHYGDQIIFIVSTRGLAIAGSAKNFAYAETPSQDAIVVQGDLDAAASDPVHRDGALFRRPLAGKWWLELDTR